MPTENKATTKLFRKLYILKYVLTLENMTLLELSFLQG
jgi:hypothetical protein